MTGSKESLDKMNNSKTVIYVISEAEHPVYTAESIYQKFDGSWMDCIGDFLSRSECEDDILGILYDYRYMVKNGQPLTEAYIRGVLGKYDFILPRERMIGYERIPEHGGIISTIDSWKEFYLYIRETGIDQIDPHKLSVILKDWILERGLRVKTENISDEDPTKWNTGFQSIGVVKNYIDIILKDYIELRLNSGFSDSFAGNDPYTGDFGGKIPVWMCWWQGIDSAPELVQSCVNSVRDNLPEMLNLIIITLDNWQEYATFTDTVIDRFNNEIISYTHLSDVLRAELLYRYGGLWIDATYFVPVEIDAGIFDKEFYSTRFEPPLWGMDIMQGRWSSSLMACRRHDITMQFLMEGWWIYWEQAGELVDYFTLDYILDSGYRHFDAIKKEIDDIPVCSSDVYSLQLLMNSRISEWSIAWIKSAAPFYKINRRNKYYTVTETGEQTIYGYITGIKVEDNKSITAVIYPQNEADLIKQIRENNPHSILDKCGYFATNRWISRGYIDDLICHELIIHLEIDPSEYGQGRIVMDSIYDGYVERGKVFDNEYDLIIAVP